MVPSNVWISKSSKAIPNKMCNKTRLKFYYENGGDGIIWKPGRHVKTYRKLIGSEETSVLPGMLRPGEFWCLCSDPKRLKTVGEA